MQLGPCPAALVLTLCAPAATLAPALFLLQHATMQMDRRAPNGAVNEAVEQVAYADRLLLNKTDLVSAAEKDAVIRR